MGSGESLGQGSMGEHVPLPQALQVCRCQVEGSKVHLIAKICICLAQTLRQAFGVVSKEVEESHTKAFALALCGGHQLHWVAAAITLVP